MWTSLPRMAEVAQPLLVLLEQHEEDDGRQVRVVMNRAIAASAWVAGRAKACSDSRDLAMHAVELSHPRDGCVVVMFPNASDEFWRYFLTHVPQDEVDAASVVEDMSNESLESPSILFRGSQLRSATLKERGFEIVSMYQRLEYLL